MGEFVDNNFQSEEGVPLHKKALEEIIEKQQKITKGGVNCVPHPFKRLLNDFPGVEQAQYICVTSYTKGAKTQLVNYMFIFEVIVFAYFTKADFDFRVLYFPLEETKERIIQRFMSWLLYKVTKGQMRISPSELRSTAKAVDNKVIDRLQQFDVQNLLEFFDEHIIFFEDKNPTGIYKSCKQYAEEHGKVYKKIIKIKDEFGVLQDKEVFDRYEQDNPNEFRLVIIDTINLVSEERGLTKKQCMDKMSEYCAIELRNKYLMSPIVIQQQAFESEGNESIKLGRIRPSVAGLGDSKYISRDADIVIGLFSPFRFGISEYFDYDIRILKDHIRFLEICINRNGEMGALLPLWFDGAVCDFRELPKPSDKVAMDRIYNYCKQLEAQKEAQQTPSPTKSATTLFLSIKQNIKHFMSFDKLLNN